MGTTTTGGHSKSWNPRIAEENMASTFGGIVGPSKRISDEMGAFGEITLGLRYSRFAAVGIPRIIAGEQRSPS